MEMIIRFATEKDMDTLVSMWKDFMGGDFAEKSNLKMSELNINRWRSLARMSVEQRMIKVADIDGEAVGFILLNYGVQPFETIQKSALILELYVVPRHRRKGYGRRLLHDGLHYVKSLGCDLMALNVLSDNVNAIRFYEREGFEPVFHTMKKDL